MLLLIIIFGFYVMHVHFMLKNIFMGASGAEIFYVFVPYRFSRDVALDTLVLGVSCIVAFVLGYIVSKCVFDNRPVKPHDDTICDNFLYKSVVIMNIFIAFQIGFSLFIISMVGLNYSALFNLKMSMSFLFEIRMVGLLLVCFVCLNKPPSEWLKDKKLRLSAILLALYFVVSVLLQSRSALFECAAIIVFPWLMWQKNKIKIKYVVMLFCTMIIPNLIVLPRFGGVMDLKQIIAGVFSFEYTVALSNIVSAAIENNHPPLIVDFFLSIPSLLIPSPIRNAIGLNITPGTGGDYYLTILQDAGVLGGGFSMLAEAYINLSWWAIILFLLLGYVIGKFIKGAARVGKVNLLYATAPLMYASFLINLRNNFATFAKYSIQLIIIAFIVKAILKARWVPLSSAINDEHRCISRLMP